VLPRRWLSTTHCLRISQISTCRWRCALPELPVLPEVCDLVTLRASMQTTTPSPFACPQPPAVFLVVSRAPRVYGDALESAAGSGVPLAGVHLGCSGPSRNPSVSCTCKDRSSCICVCVCVCVGDLSYVSVYAQLPLPGSTFRVRLVSTSRFALLMYVGRLMLALNSVCARRLLPELR
jgi:hypothetical protein